MTGEATRVQRRLAAILAADVVGYSAHMSRDEEGTHAQIKALHWEVINPAVELHHGRVVKTTGDGFLVEFSSPVEAVRCALAVQKALAPGPLQLRIGINLGDVIIEPDGDIYGEGVNVAARLEALCDPGGVLISGKVYDEAEGRIEAAFESRGEQTIKNIARAVRTYSVTKHTKLANTQGSPKRPSLPERPSLAVLPFTNMSGDPEQEYFADGVVEDIITALSRVRWFFVIARNSSFTYKGRAVDIRQVGRELGVRFVLEGSVRKAGNRVRLSGQLIEATTGRHVWADKFDGALEDIFELQDRITESVVGAIEPNLRRLEIERALSKPTGSLDAYDLYLRALPELYAFSEEGLTRAEELLQQALALDPNYSDAWAGVANVAFFRQVGGWKPPDEARPIGLDAALKAVQADPENASGLSIAAATLAAQGGSLDQAVGFADRALELNRNSAQVLTFCALAYNFNGDPDKALSALKSARRLSPLDPRSYFILHQMAQAHFFARRFEEAAEYAARAVNENPRFTPVRRFLAASLAHMGRIDEAKKQITELLVVQPNSRLSLSRTSPYRHPWMRELYVGGLQMAGLPE